MNRKEFETALASLIAELIPTIGDEYRASNDPQDDTPGMALTVGADTEGWSYQTGDNSYTGGAYGYATWGVGYLYRDSNPVERAHEIADELAELCPDDAPIFTDGESQS